VLRVFIHKLTQLFTYFSKVAIARVCNLDCGLDGIIADVNLNNNKLHFGLSVSPQTNHKSHANQRPSETSAV